MTMEPNFYVSFQEKRGERTLCLIALSDAWRRAARFDQPQLAKAFNKQARMICAASQYFDMVPPYGTEKKPIEVAAKAFENIVWLAEKNNIRRVVLPIYKDSDAGHFIQKNILRHYEGDLNIQLQEHPYMSRLQQLGHIKLSRKTAFDYGLAYIVK